MIKRNQSDPAPLLVFGAHPDDIEFGCGGVIVREAQAGRRAHFVVCSRGEAATNGTPAIRMREAERAAALLSATLEFIDLGGDAHLEVTASNAIRLAAIIRRAQPQTVLAPTVAENQHPDHGRLGRLVRDACRLARYGGLRELRRHPPHTIGQLFFYSIAASEPVAPAPILVDLSPPGVVARWTAAMQVHASQMKTRRYVEMQLTRARLHGLSAGLEYAMPIYPADSIVVNDLSALDRGARQF